MVEPDTRGVDALSRLLDDNLLEPLIWLELETELGGVPQAPRIDPFDNAPWRQLPTIEELEHLWSTRDELLSVMIHDLGVAAHGEGPDLMKFMAMQRQLAEWELDFKKQREAYDAEGAGTDDGAAAEGAAAVVSTDAGGGSVVVSGGSKDSYQVGKGRKVGLDPHAGRPPKVSRRRGPGKAAG
jgi:hypothetical protein